MATRAERYKATEQRKGESTGKKGRAAGKKATTASASAKSRRRTPSLAKQMGRVQPADERRYGGPSTGIRNKKKASSRTTADLEDSRAPAPPSRKSTRRSSNRTKAGTQLTARQQMRMNSPDHKHAERRR